MGVLEELADKYGGFISDLRFDPKKREAAMSTHEIIAVNPREFDQPDAAYEKMVQEINQSEVEYGEQLSDHIYRYRSKETGLEMYQEGKWYENRIQIPTPEKIPKQ